MNAAVARWLEAIRQRALVMRLGQVACRDECHDLMVDAGFECHICGAAL